MQVGDFVRLRHLPPLGVGRIYAESFSGYFYVTWLNGDYTYAWRSWGESDLKVVLPLEVLAALS